MFGGLFAYAFDLASSSAGLSGWQLLFLFEGLLTVVVAVVIYFCLPDFPNTASWLTDKEKAFVQARLPPNAPMADEMHFRWSEIKEALQDVRLWMFTAIWATQTVGTHGTRFYQSTVIANLGFTSIAQAQLLNLPISLLTILLIGISGVLADSARFPRPLYPLTFLSIILACYGVLYRYPSNGAVYAATMIANACSSAWFPLMVCKTPLLVFRYRILIFATTTVAVACANNIASNRLRLLHWLRQQLRPNRWSHRASDLSQPICAAVHGVLWCRDGHHRSMYPGDYSDVVRDQKHRT